MSEDKRVPTPATVLPVEPVQPDPVIIVEHDWRPKVAPVESPPDPATLTVLGPTLKRRPV